MDRGSSMIGKRKLVAVVTGAVVAAGAAFGITGLVAGPAHAQGTSSFTIIGIAPDSQGSEPQVQVSFTCSTPGYIDLDVTAIQGGTATGLSGNTTCTGSTQTAAIDLQFSSSAYLRMLGAGSVQVGVTAAYVNESSYPYVTTYTGTTTPLTYP
jgi:hypothetical protein